MVIVEQLVEWGLAGETEVLGENLPQRHFVHKIPHDQTRAAAMESQRLTAWAMARPLRHLTEGYIDQGVWPFKTYLSRW
jgi:hypothetical protein